MWHLSRFRHLQIIICQTLKASVFVCNQASFSLIYISEKLKQLIGLNLALLKGEFTDYIYIRFMHLSATFIQAAQVEVDSSFH